MVRVSVVWGFYACIEKLFCVPHWYGGFAYNCRDLVYLSWLLGFDRWCARVGFVVFG